MLVSENTRVAPVVPAELRAKTLRARGDARDDRLTARIRCFFRCAVVIRVQCRSIRDCTASPVSSLARRAEWRRRQSRRRSPRRRSRRARRPRGKPRGRRSKRRVDAKRLRTIRGLRCTGRRDCETEANATVDISPVQVDDGGRRRNRVSVFAGSALEPTCKSVSCFRQARAPRVHDGEAKRKRDDPAKNGAAAAVPSQ
jgi:hypothetical protein